MTTTSSKNIHTAMVEAQAEFPTVGFDKQNPAFRSKYASLTGIVEAIRPILNRHGCYITHNSRLTERGVWVETRIVHGESGTQIVTETELPLEAATAQKVGGVLTYGRRYTLSMALGVVSDEDDDAQAVSTAQTPQRTAPRPATPQTAPQPPQTGNGNGNTAARRLPDFTKRMVALNGDGGPASPDQYNFLSGAIDAVTETDAHGAVLEFLLGREVSKDNPPSFKMAGQLLDWLRENKTKKDGGGPNPNYRPDVVEIVRYIWQELQAAAMQDDPFEAEAVTG